MKRKTFLETIISPLVIPFISCDKSKRFQGINADSKFFMNHPNKKDTNGADNFDYILNEEHIYLTPNPKNNLGILAGREYPNLDSLKILEKNMTMEGRTIYSIEKVILSK